ncbi:MAG: ABC transporter substrate-binding protein, partial [Myxococcota bacterium]
MNVETANCSLVQGPLQADNTLILGAIQPTSGANADIGEAIVNGQSLAIEEINSAGGLPGARRIALVACDSAGSEQQGLAVADHLTNIVGVPAITGPAFSGIFVSVRHAKFWSSRSAISGAVAEGEIVRT